jgi:uncharacterized protein (UPF0303 family)
MTKSVPPFSADFLETFHQLDFTELTNDDAVDLGLFAVHIIREWNFSLAVEIILRDDTVFRAKLRATNADNDLWLRGKAAVTHHFGEPSLLVRLRHEEAGTPFEERDDIDHATFKAYGGSVPLRVKGQLVGTLTMSGEPDAIDHYVATETLKGFFATKEAKNH